MTVSSNSPNSFSLFSFPVFPGPFRGLSSKSAALRVTETTEVLAFLSQETAGGEEGGWEYSVRVEVWGGSGDAPRGEDGTRISIEPMETTLERFGEGLDLDGLRRGGEQTLGIITENLADGGGGSLCGMRTSSSAGTSSSDGTERGQVRFFLVRFWGGNFAVMAGATTVEITSES